MKLFNVTRQTLLAQNVRIADTFFSRMIGLIGKKQISPQEALLIPRCQSIHMFFMAFYIDVLFVDKENRVVGMVKNIRPFSLSPIFFKSSYAVELSSGKIVQTQTSLGDVLMLEMT